VRKERAAGSAAGRWDLRLADVGTGALGVPLVAGLIRLGRHEVK
jgi:hypothetical protein